MNIREHPVNMKQYTITLRKYKIHVLLQENKKICNFSE